MITSHQDSRVRQLVNSTTSSWYVGLKQTRVGIPSTEEKERGHFISYFSFGKTEIASEVSVSAETLGWEALAVACESFSLLVHVYSKASLQLA